MPLTLQSKISTNNENEACISLKTLPVLFTFTVNSS